MRFKPGELAYIVRPWVIDEDIGRPVTIVRPGIIGQSVKTRGGTHSQCNSLLGPSVLGWLVDANGDGFPCFIADECLRKLGGIGECDEMVQKLGKPEEVTA